MTFQTMFCMTFHTKSEMHGQIGMGRNYSTGDIRYQSIVKKLRADIVLYFPWEMGRLFFHKKLRVLKGHFTFESYGDVHSKKFRYVQISKKFAQFRDPNPEHRCGSLPALALNHNGKIVTNPKRW